MTDLAIQNVIFFLIGGLALFLFGLRFMSDALQLVAGDRTRKIIEKGTKNPVRGVFTGILVSGFIQSSSVTTVLTVGLVNAGLLSLRQAIGVIMGANIGTTITAFLIGFKLEAYALPILGLGVFLYLFIKKPQVKQIGQALLGFGILLLGLTLMGEGINPLKNMVAFQSLMSSLSHNTIGAFIIGAAITGIIQSSSATIGALQQFAYHGAMTYQQAIPILLGANIGTTVTALLASIGTSVAARRTALTHFIFNVIGIIIWLPLFILGIFEPLVKFVTNMVLALIPGYNGYWATLNIKLQIAQTHAIYNLSNTILLLPFVAALAWIVIKLIPDKNDNEEESGTAIYIRRRFLDNPGVAMAQAMRETVRMGRLAARSFSYSIEYFNHHGHDNKVRGAELEETVNRLQRDITDYVVLASEKQLTKADSAKAYLILQSITDIERIGDHSMNIMEQADYATLNQVTFSGEAQEELASLIKVTDETLAITMVVLDKGNRDLARQVVELDKEVDRLQEECRKAHIRRLNERRCNGNNGAVFLDVVAHLGRIGDHCSNIAEYVLNQDNPS